MYKFLITFSLLAYSSLFISFSFLFLSPTLLLKMNREKNNLDKRNMLPNTISEMTWRYTFYSFKINTNMDSLFKG
jgi:hypothetical protein